MTAPKRLHVIDQRGQDVPAETSRGQPAGPVTGCRRLDGDPVVVRIDDHRRLAAIRLTELDPSAGTWAAFPVTVFR